MSRQYLAGLLKRGRYPLTLVGDRQSGAFKRLIFLSLLTTILVAACAAPPNTTSITKFEAPGNLQALDNLGCVQPDALLNTYTAADLYHINAECIERKDLESAVYASALGGVYARYDTMRVADRTAHQAQTVLMLNLGNSLPEEDAKEFYARLSEAAGNPERLAAICARIRTIGAPQYHPAYMIQHGMGAFLGGGYSDDEGLVENFDSASAWEKALDTYLHCPKR